MTQNRTTIAYLAEIVEGLKEKADDANIKTYKTDYELGYAMAMYEVISLLHQQAKAFDIPLSEIGLEGIDPERDYLCIGQLSAENKHIIATTETGIPSLETFQYEGSQLSITVNLYPQIKQVSCDHVLAFRMIEEGCAFHTLNKPWFDGKTWLFKLKHSNFLEWFNAESESIYADTAVAYVLVTQDQIFEFVTNDDLVIQ